MPVPMEIPVANSFSLCLSVSKHLCGRRKVCVKGSLSGLLKTIKGAVSLWSGGQASWPTRLRGNHHTH